MNKMKCLFSGLFVALLIQVCGFEKVEVKKKQTEQGVKTLSPPSVIEVQNNHSDSFWWFSIDGRKYFISPYPKVKKKSIDVIEDTPTRKTIKMVSVPFSEAGVVLTQELTQVKGFPGLFFRIRQKNTSNSPMLRRIENYLLMKEPKYFTQHGKHTVGVPWQKKNGIKNWIFLPDGKKGLGVILNYSLSGMSFCSTFGRQGSDGKRIEDASKSRWGIRRTIELKPGETGEMLFALVAADSPEETARLCVQIQKENLFPKLKLEKITSPVENKTNIKKTTVEPIFDPAQYSAENTDTKTIDDWMKCEIRPEQFDIWHGKKDKIYLNGSWKFIKLAGTQNASNCAYGIEHDFQKNDFNDSKWFNQPVPFFWNTPFKFEPEAKSKRRLNFGGVGWYRKKFILPGKYQEERVILCFQGVEQECTVYVNGKKAIFHKTISVDRPAGIHGIQQDPFEVDITDFVKFGEANTIAVKVYDNGRIQKRYSEKTKKIYSGIGGIWQEVFLEIRPQIYLKKAICSFDIKSSVLTVEALVMNTEKHRVKEELELELSPWQSVRYSFAKGESERHKLGEFSLEPGINGLRFKIKITKSQLWSPESPYLYAMKLKNGQGATLGQERIGLREIRVGENYFFLNGKKTTLRGQQGFWYTLMSSSALWKNMGLMNRRNAIGKWFDAYKSLNHNIVRNHSTIYPHSFYDIADEKGVMIYAGYYFQSNMPFFDKNGRITNFYKKKIKNTAEEICRFPSIVLLSLGNEKYDSHLIGEKIDSYKHYIEQIYAEMKKHAPLLPLSACGRPPTSESLNKTNTKPYAYAKNYAKTDFYAAHNYLMCWYDIAFAEDDDWNCGLKRYYDSYVLDGGSKAFWNTESIISSIAPLHLVYSYEYDKQFRPHIHNDMIDRKWFVENWKIIPLPKNGNFALDRSVPKFGFLDTVLRDRSMRTQAGFMKRITELHRRKRDFCAGVVGNDAQIFKSGAPFPSDTESFFNKSVAIATRQANQLVLACLDGKWNRNIFSGRNRPTPLYVMNDHENDIKNSTVSISIEPLDYKGKAIFLKELKLGKLSPAEIKIVQYTFETPENIVSGHYKVVLRTNYQYQDRPCESLNDYKTYILNHNDVKLSVKPKNEVALLNSPDTKVKQTAAMLKKLKIPFSLLKNLKRLEDFKILILPPGNSTDTAEIVEWVKRGGKLLSLAQNGIRVPKGLPQINATGRYGFFTELILKTHPVLRNLEQSDFRYWNGPRDSILNKWVVKNCILPLNEGVIACLMTSGNRIGMSITEYRLGEGVCLLSQMEATERFDTDSVATKYLVNTLNYCLGDWHAKDAPLIEATEKKIVAFEVDPKKAFFIDMRKECTMGFADDKAGDQKGGWTDQGPGIDMRNLPTGEQVFNGVPFNIINPADNNGKACIVLRGSKLTKCDFLPLKKRISVNRRAQTLYFLVSAAWVGKTQKRIAKLKISEEADGSDMFSSFQIDLIAGKNIIDWWNPVRKKPVGVEMGWVGMTGEGGTIYEVGTFIIEWKNPTPQKIIQYIEFVSSAESIPILLGITGVND